MGFIPTFVHARMKSIEWPFGNNLGLVSRAHIDKLCFL